MHSKNIFPRSLQYLIAVAKHGNFTHAAEALYVSQPALSQQIKKLEDSLQSTLLDRSRKKIQLTDAGKSYVEYAHLAWKNLDAGMRAIHDVENLKGGILCIGLTPITDHLIYCLAEQFNTKYPNIHLKLLEMPQNDIELAVLEGSIDVGIVFSNTLANSIHSNELKINPLFEEQLCFVVGNKHIDVGETTINLEKFNQHSLALLSADFVLRQLVDVYCNQHNVNPNVSIESNSLSVVIEIIQTSSLASILPKGIVNKQYGLHAINLSPKLPCKSVSLIYRQKGYKSFSCLAFTKMAIDWANYKQKKMLKLKSDLVRPLHKSTKITNMVK